MPNMGLQWVSRVQGHSLSSVFICQMKAVQGVKVSCNLQEILVLYNNTEHRNNWDPKNVKNTPVIVRGVYDPNAEIPLALNHNLYTMLRCSKQYRRSFLYALLTIFSEIVSRLHFPMP